MKILRIDVQLNIGIHRNATMSRWDCPFDIPKRSENRRRSNDFLGKLTHLNRGVVSGIVWPEVSFALGCNEFSPQICNAISGWILTMP